MRHRKIVAGDGDRAHGTRTGYAVYGCRGECCRTAEREYAYQHSLVRMRRPLAKDDPRHGTRNAYSNWGCRCDACKTASFFYALGRLR